MKNIFFMLLLGLGFNALAQNPEEPAEGEKQKMDALKIAFITEKLDLTSKEAEGFWPVFNRYDKEAKTLRKKQRESSRTFMQKATSTEQEADKFLNEQLALKQQEVDLLKKFIPEFKKVLPLPKVARLLSLEQEFKMQLLHKLKDRRGPRP